MASTERPFQTPRTPGIILLTHGTAGEALIASAEMIVGRMETVVSVSLMPGDDLNSYMKRVQDEAKAMPPGSLILVDLIYGTPCNRALAVAAGMKDIFVVSGVNLPMLIEAVSLRERARGKDLAEMVAQAARDGIKDALKTYPEASFGPDSTVPPEGRPVTSNSSQCAGSDSNADGTGKNRR